MRFGFPLAARLGLTLWSILLFAAPAVSQDVSAMVERYAARVSGIAINDLLVTQSLTVVNPQNPADRVTGDQRLSIKFPGRQRLETRIAGQREVQLLSGGRMVILRGGKAFEAPPPEGERQAGRLVIPFDRTAAGLLSQWRSFGVKTDVSHVRTAEGRQVTVIGALSGDRSSPAVWLDPEYGVVRMVTKDMSTGTPRTLELAYSDHRKVTGELYYPYEQQGLLDGKLVFVARVRSVEINVGLADSLFDPDALLKEGSR
jgi:outer membrane lipoprotein-sorting protein